MPVPKDYDGDTRADLAVFYNGMWYVKTTTGVILSEVGFGRLDENGVTYFPWEYPGVQPAGTKNIY